MLQATVPAEHCMVESLLPGSAGRSTESGTLNLGIAGECSVTCFVVLQRMTPRDIDLAKAGGAPNGRGGDETGSLHRPKRRNGLLGRSSAKSSAIAEDTLFKFVALPCRLVEGWGVRGGVGRIPWVMA